jgi:two-component system sensor histidine kinase ChvG
MSSLSRALFGQLGRIRVRLLFVNLIVLLVPIAGLEFARIYEDQLLAGLERDMRNQAALARELVETTLDDGGGLDDPRVSRTLTRAAAATRTRTRVLDAEGKVRVDSHADGPPEGPEPPPPTLIPRSVYDSAVRSRLPSSDVAESWSMRSLPRETWPPVEARREVRSALAGRPDAYTRIRDEAPAVFLFVAEPVRQEGRVVGVIYAARSTRQVLAELYRIRTGLIRVLVVAVVFTMLLTLALAWSISRPLSKLAKAARRIALGERAKVPVGGTGEIRELGEALATMTEKLDGRMTYIREFAADVAHELKSPLTSIRGAAELLGEGAAEDPATRERFLKNIELDAERLDRLLTRLLELSRLDASQAPMEAFDLVSLVERVVERTHTPEQPVTVGWSIPSRSWRGREHDLERALLNLVENALRFSPEGKPVQIEVGSSHDRRELRIRVRDQGPGVPEALRAKIFERFFTTDAERNGTGLGLAIVSSVAEAHGGRVELESVPGRGAAFTLVLQQRSAA